ncbi:MAG: hypothetical protein ACRC1M_06700 [Methanobacteriaceae archaeon]
MGDDNKVKFTGTFDPDVLALAKLKFGNVSGTLNDLLKIAVYGDDEEDKLISSIEKLSKELNVKKDKLCKIREKKKQKKLLTGDIIKVTDWAVDVSKRVGSVNIDQLKAECTRNNVDIDIVKDELESLQIRVVDFLV